MDLSNLKPAKGSVKNRKRIGRGQGSGRGGTSTRGHKGQQSRSGYSRKVGFEGGQQPLQRRVPKFGFTNINRKEYRGINLDTLQWLVDNKKVKEVNIETLITNGLVSKNDLVKILGRGELTTKLEVKAHAFSKSARTAVEERGGKAVVLRSYKTKDKDAKVTTTVKKNKEKPQLNGGETKAKETKKSESETKTKEVTNKKSKSKEAVAGEEETLTKEKPQLSKDEVKGDQLKADPDKSQDKPKTNGDVKTITKTSDPVASADTKTGKTSKDN